MFFRRGNKPVLLAAFGFFFFIDFTSKACQCPVTNLGKPECNKYEIIFKGKVLSVKSCDDKPGEATFEVQELYKGNAALNFKVMFRCDQECYYEFKAGEEWIIYSRYRQMNLATMDFCSRSRRWFRNDREDYYLMSNGNTYEEEVQFLRDSLGLHRLLKNDNPGDRSRNQLPNTRESVLILLVSVAAIVLFYILFSRFVK